MPDLVYRFGPFEADASKGELRKFGIRVRLERKPWQVLVALLEHPGEAVSRTQLQQLLWGNNVFVDFENGLNVAIHKLRAALGDSADHPHYVEAADGGYRFLAAVEPRAAERGAIRAVLPSTPTNQPAPLPQTQGAPSATIGPYIGRAEKFPPWRRAALFTAVVLSCIALLAFAGKTRFWRESQSPSSARANKTMLVVLPFENLSGDPGQEYLSDGLTEELSKQLGHESPSQLGVIGRTSAMVYKHSPRTIRQIGDELGVDYVVEGSVRRGATRVRITAKLVQVSDQAHVWAASYDENLGDLLTLESKIASEIARQVGVSIAIAQATKRVPRHPPKPEAHEAYLRGRHYWNQRNREGWKNAEEYFRLATLKDPDYAEAYAGLAASWIPRAHARAAALKAIALDPSSGEAYAALAWVQLYRYLDPSAAAAAFRQAIALSPNYAPAHYTYAECLLQADHTHEAIAEIKKAISLDPLSPLFHSGLAATLASLGRLNEALEEQKIVFELDPQFANGYGVLGYIYTQQGKYKEAIAEFQREEKLGRDLQLGRLGMRMPAWETRSAHWKSSLDCKRWTRRQRACSTI